MLDLEPGVQLDEIERPVGAEEELEGAGVAVADRAAGTLGSGLHRLARVVVERRRRRLLDQLLMAPLDRALALAERQDAALTVGEHLDLDMPRGRDRLLQIEASVAEGRLRLERRGAVGRVELVGPAHQAHALPAAACRRLQQYRVADAVRCLAGVVQAGRALGPGNERNARPPSAPPWPAPCRPCAPSRPRPGRRRRGRCPRRPRRRPGSPPGSPSPGGRPRSRSSSRRRRATEFSGSSRSPGAARCRSARSASRTCMDRSSAVE